jgi:hypothetical protein
MPVDEFDITLISPGMMDDDGGSSKRKRQVLSLLNAWQKQPRRSVLKLKRKRSDQ